MKVSSELQKDLGGQHHIPESRVKAKTTISVMIGKLGTKKVSAFGRVKKRTCPITYRPRERNVRESRKVGRT